MVNFDQLKLLKKFWIFLGFFYFFPCNKKRKRSLKLLNSNCLLHDFSVLFYKTQWYINYLKTTGKSFAFLKCRIVIFQIFKM